MKRFITAAAVSLACALPASAGVTQDVRAEPGLTIGVIGDTPYTAAQVTAFPALVGDVNADPDVRRVVHVGDIKSGSTPCADAYFGTIRSLLDTFRDPLVYTPGDNEWTDCHRAAAGGFVPTERLTRLREVFFDRPGHTLGVRDARVRTQADDDDHAAYVENTLWTERGIVLGAVHVVGSNNDLAPWFGVNETDAQRTERLAEYRARMAANLDWIDQTFDLAEKRRAPAVVLAMQADMWDAFSVANNLPLDGFNPIVDRIAKRSRTYGRPVLLLQGDSHEYLVDHPLADGSAVHGVTTKAPNVTRVVVEGGQASEWLRVTITRDDDSPFILERVTVA